MYNGNDEMIGEGLYSPPPKYPIWIDVFEVEEI